MADEYEAMTLKNENFLTQKYSHKIDFFYCEEEKKMAMKDLMIAYQMGSAKLQQAILEKASSFSLEFIRSYQGELHGDVYTDLLEKKAEKCPKCK